MQEQREVRQLASKLLEDSIMKQSTWREADTAGDAKEPRWTGRDPIFCFRTSGEAGLRLTRQCSQAQQQQRSQTLEEYLGILGTKWGPLSTNQSICLSFKPWLLASLSSAPHGAPSWRATHSVDLGPAGVQNVRPGGVSDLGWSLETSAVLCLASRARSEGEPAIPRRVFEI